MGSVPFKRVGSSSSLSPASGAGSPWCQGDPRSASPSAEVVNPVEMPDFGGSHQPVGRAPPYAVHVECDVGRFNLRSCRHRSGGVARVRERPAEAPRADRGGRGS